MESDERLQPEPEPLPGPSFEPGKYWVGVRKNDALIFNPSLKFRY